LWPARCVWIRANFVFWRIFSRKTAKKIWQEKNKSIAIRAGLGRAIGTVVFGGKEIAEEALPGTAGKRLAEKEVSSVGGTSLQPDNCGTGANLNSWNKVAFLWEAAPGKYE
jgi:hypothetical protein